MFYPVLVCCMTSPDQMNLVGLFVTPVLTDGWGFSRPEWKETAFHLRDLATKSTMRMTRFPPVTVGTEVASEKAGEGKDSAGARLYTRLINVQYHIDPKRPLLINMGGQSATLASSYLLDPTIAKKSIVYYTDIKVYNGHYQWASQIIAKHFRAVSWGDDHWWITKRCQNEWRVLPRPEHCEGKDNDANSGEWRLLTAMNVPLLDYMVHQLQTRVEYCQGNSKWDAFGDGGIIHAYLPGIFSNAALREVRGGQVLHIAKFTEINEARVKAFTMPILLNAKAYGH
ncbi:MAG: hypothetical protein ABJA67_11480 [Chthonomonadales bacterium]